MNKKVTIVILAFATALGGCSTAIKYTAWQDGDAIQSGALRFGLQETTITLATPAPAKTDSSPPKSNCPDKVSSANWWTCFNQVAAHAAMAPSTANPSKVYVATPDDAKSLHLATTTVSGTLVSGQDTLYSVVTVKYSSNATTVIAGAGSGAVTGFGIAGPYGAVAGLVIGGISSGTVPFNLTKNPVPAAPPKVTDYICPDATVDLSNASDKNLRPSIVFPVAINSEGAKPISSASGIQSVKDNSLVCWHELPNAASLGTILPQRVGSATPASPLRQPISGDGWLYRVVAISDQNEKAPDPTQPLPGPPGTMLATAYFADTDARHDFPYSSCRKVQIQITWWKDLADAIATSASGKDASPEVVNFATVAADSAFLTAADLKKGGVINFKADCGANVSMDVDSSAVADINAVVTASQNIYKAEQTWATSQKK
jgi:hypothetical protein